MDIDQARANVSEIWGVTTTIDCGYQRPIRDLFLRWLSENPDSTDVLSALTG